jgi:hypothetical protein
MPASELPFANFFGCMVLDTVIGGLEVKLKLMGQERVTRSFPSSTMRTYQASHRFGDPNRWKSHRMRSGEVGFCLTPR